MVEFQVLCPVCMRENHNIPTGQFYPVQYMTDMPMEVTCQRGHKFCVIVDTYLFEVLYEYAFKAFMHGDFRGAVYNFASGLERLLETATLILMAEGINRSEDALTLWKDFFSNKSERQLASFITLYFLRFRSLPFSKKEYEGMCKLRNEVVHKGGIINEKKAREYGDYAIQVMHEILKNLVENINTEVLLQCKFAYLKQQTKSVKQDKDSAILTVHSSIVSWLKQNDKECEVEKQLLAYSIENPNLYAAKAAQANQEQKRMWMTDTGDLCLVSDEEIEQYGKKVYRGTKTFDQYCQEVEKDCETEKLLKHLVFY